MLDSHSHSYVARRPPAERDERPVSVVIPTYNRAEILPRAIESALNQTYRNLEVLVVDDGSTDETPSVVEGFDDQRVTYHRVSQNGGANRARNIGVEEATGEYISFLDSDDELLPEHIERVVAAIESVGHACVGGFTGYRLTSEDGERTVTIDDPPVLRSVGELVDRVCRTTDANAIGGFSCVTVRRETLLDEGGLDESLESYQDLDLYIRLLREHCLVGVQEPLTVYHIHGEQISTDPERQLRGQKQLLKKHRAVLGARGEAFLQFAQGHARARTGDVAGSRTHFVAAARRDPTNAKYWFHVLATLAGNSTYGPAMELKQRLKELLH
jgi:glycosyltransferase involved in cell wall biosynthesis